MNLSQVLQTQWAADSTLNGLLPAANVNTGIYFNAAPTFPYATITRPGGTVESRANDGTRIDALTVRITVYHGADYYDEGVTIAQAVDDAFDNTNFNLTGDKVLVMQIDGPPEEIQDQESGNWYWICDFTARIEMEA